MRDNVKAAAERLRRLESGDGDPWRTDTYGPRAPHDVEEDRRELSLAFIATADRLGVMVEDYLKLGSEAEKVGHGRRAASYRSVANMLGVLLQGSNPSAVDFLARFEEESEATRRQLLLGEALHKMLAAVGVYGPDALATGPELLAAVEDYLTSVEDDAVLVTPEGLKRVGFSRGQQSALSNDLVWHGGPGKYLVYYAPKNSQDLALWGVSGEWLPKALHPKSLGDVRRLVAALTPDPE